MYSNKISHVNNFLTEQNYAAPISNLKEQKNNNI